MNNNFIAWLNTLKDIDPGGISIDKFAREEEIEQIIDAYKQMHNTPVKNTTNEIAAVEIYFDNDINSKFRIKIENIENGLEIPIPKQFCNNVSIRFMLTKEYQLLKLRNDLVSIKNKYDKQLFKEPNNEIKNLIMEFMGE